MDRTKLTARKATGGKVPRQQLATRAPRCESKFLKEFGMPTLLWRVLHSVGYPEGKEPHYYWSKEQLGDQTLVYVEAVIPPRGDDPNRGGWFFGSKGRTPWEGANRASFAVLRDIMESSPEVLGRALAGVFPRDDP
jgi:hypothetical protein